MDVFYKNLMLWTNPLKREAFYLCGGPDKQWTTTNGPLRSEMSDSILYKRRKRTQIYSTKTSPPKRRIFLRETSHVQIPRKNSFRSSLLKKLSFESMCNTCGSFHVHESWVLLHFPPTFHHDKHCATLASSACVATQRRKLHLPDKPCVSTASVFYKIAYNSKRTYQSWQKANAET